MWWDFCRFCLTKEVLDIKKREEEKESNKHKQKGLKNKDLKTQHLYLCARLDLKT